MNNAYLFEQGIYTIVKGTTMKHLIAALIMTFATTAFAGPEIILNDDGSPFITIEKILLPNQKGEETESGICCSWTTTGTHCIPTCFIEDGKMIPAASLPPVNY